MTAMVAYLFSRFPVITETFLLRQALELRRQGCPLVLFALRRDRQSVRHPEAAELLPEVRFLEPLSPRTLAASRRLLRQAPGRYARLAGEIVAGNRTSLDFLAKGLAMLPGVVGLAEQMRRLDVRHVHGVFGTHTGLAALLAAELLGVEFSFAVRGHDLFVDTSMLAEKARRARFVAAVSEFNRRRLLEIAGPAVADRVTIVRSAIDLAEFPFRTYRPSGAERRILAVGRLHEYKGHEHLIRACALLRDRQPEQAFGCDIVGEGPRRPLLERLIAELGLGRQVRLLGARPNPEVRALMARADTMVVPSVVARSGVTEGLPNVLFEAMALGTPVVASAVAGIPELVLDGETGLLAPEQDPAAIRDALLACWADPAAAAARARRGRALVEARHDLKASAAYLAGLFRQAVEAAAPPGSAALAEAGRR